MVVEDALTGVLSAKRAGCCVSALTRTFPAHELIEAGANFTFEDFVSLKRFLSVSEREMAARTGTQKNNESVSYPRN
jgi:beta-phosphoglucomutase-like phosphatase (HAD superfamily)